MHYILLRLQTCLATAIGMLRAAALRGLVRLARPPPSFLLFVLLYPSTAAASGSAETCGRVPPFSALKTFLTFYVVNPICSAQLSWLELFVLSFAIIVSHVPCTLSQFEYIVQWRRQEVGHALTLPPHREQSVCANVPFKKRWFVRSAKVLCTGYRNTPGRKSWLRQRYYMYF